MKSKYTHKSKYFYGNKISGYGLENKRVDYKTLAQAFDAVLVNDITKLFYADINGEYSEAEQVNGFIDNYEEIAQLEYQIDDLDEEKDAEQIAKLNEKIDELREEQDRSEMIFQYFIISDRGAEILQELTNEIVYYLPALDCYIWCVTHFGTSWDYVLTDIKIELEEQ